jgi:hypothetical protein
MPIAQPLLQVAGTVLVVGEPGGRGVSVRSEALPPDDLMAALEALIKALEDNIDLAQRSKRRARYIIQQRRHGRSYREIVPGRDEPLIVEMMRESVGRMSAAASRLQHSEAKALYDEGMTMEQIGRLFGVTHQRVSAMLKRARDA